MRTADSLDLFTGEATGHQEEVEVLGGGVNPAEEEAAAAAVKTVRCRT